MSKIFDALQSTQSEAAGILPALIGGEAAEGVARTMVPAVQRQESPEPAKPAVSKVAAISAPASKSVRRVALVIPASVPVLPFEDQSEEAAEQYRIARTKIIHHPRRPRTIAVTSPSTGDGKTITAINIAGALSLKAASKILLMDVDFRRSSVYGLLGLQRSPGLAEVLSGQCSFEEAVVEAEEYPNLNILVSGEPKANPSELLDSPRWHALCESVRTQYEHVILDTPPMGAVADCDLIQLAADGVLIVLRPEHTQRSSCLKALGAISKEKLIGVLLNCTKSWPLGKQGGGYGYGYGYGSVPAKEKSPMKPPANVSRLIT
jgi:capsular exopolysaccharide synthesis family protein